jgi:DNA polymerase-3 subunit epsilon
MSRNLSELKLTSEEIHSLLRLFPKGLVAVDLETTGLSPLVDKIIEIAAVKISGDGSISTFHELINPLIDIPEFTVQFHGLRNLDVANAPTIKKPLRYFWEFCQRLPVVGHNSIFDLGYLIKASHDYQLEFPPLDIFDTCKFTRSILKPRENPPENYKLGTLSHYFGFDLRHHVAMDDTMACLKILAGASALHTDHSVALEKSFIFRLSSFNKNDSFQISSKLQKLKDLVLQKKLIALDYKSKNYPSKIRAVRPIGLMPLPQGAVLFAECLVTGKNKSFLLKKIKGYSILEACLWNKQETTI